MSSSAAAPSAAGRIATKNSPGAAGGQQRAQRLSAGVRGPGNLGQVLPLKALGGGGGGGWRLQVAAAQVQKQRPTTLYPEVQALPACRLVGGVAAGLRERGAGESGATRSARGLRLLARHCAGQLRVQALHWCASAKPTSSAAITSRSSAWAGLKINEGAGL